MNAQASFPTQASKPATAPSKLWLAIGCFHISALVYVALGFLMFVLFAEESRPIAIVVAMACWGMGIGVGLVNWGLRQHRFWAWIAGLCLCGVYIPSLFMPLGGLALWGLLDGESLTAFGVRKQVPHPQ